MHEAIQSHPVAFGMVGFSLIVSLRIVIGLWLLPKHAGERLVKRIGWSVLAFIPFVGPLFYGAFYKIPSNHKSGDQASGNSDAFYGGGH